MSVLSPNSWLLGRTHKLSSDPNCSLSDPNCSLTPIVPTRPAWYLQLDVRNYFMSIDKQRLFEMLVARLGTATQQDAQSPSVSVEKGRYPAYAYLYLVRRRSNSKRRCA